MPFDAVLLSLAVIVVFLGFAGTLTWADNQTRTPRSPDLPAPKRRPSKGTHEVTMFQLRNLFRRSKPDDTDWQPWILERPKRQKINWPFWIGSPTAWLALVISSTTAFAALVYHSDELSVVTSPILMSIENGQLKIPVPKTITFINSGSRPIAILSIVMVLRQQGPEKAELDCWSGSNIEFLHVAFDQLVVKPYDITARELRFENMKPEGRASVSLTEENKKLAEDANFVNCLSFEIVPTDSPRWTKTILIARVGKSPSHLPRADPIPAYLIKRNTLWTSVGQDQKGLIPANQGVGSVILH